MASEKEGTLIQYLADDRSFLEIVNAAFRDSIEKIGADGMYLYQVAADHSCVNLIAQYATCENCRRPEAESIPMEELKYLSDFMQEIDASVEHRLGTEGKQLVSPIFMRNQAAMYISAYSRTGKFAENCMRELAQLTLVLQSVALNRNFSDSLQNSYRFLEFAIDELPVGFCVLTPECDQFLLMNQMAVNSAGVQNILTKVIPLYRDRRGATIPEQYDDETGAWYDVAFDECVWIDGNPAIVCTTIDITQKMMNQQRIEYQANNDFLTGLFNRMKCERDLAALIDRTIAADARGVVLFLDLDNFKQVNDGLGHQYGDVLLQEIANGIQSIEQIKNHCYRMGGDEFVILIPPEVFGDITKIVDDISRMFNEPWKLMDVEYYCTMSMGLAIFPDHAQTVQEIVKKADFAMYEAKKSGKNRYLWYSPDDPSKKEREEFENSIRTMVGDSCRDFTLHFQPVFDAEEKLIGAEALVRINSEQFGQLLPAEFLPVAEYLGLMNHIGNHVFEAAVHKLASWQRIFGEDFLMFINVASTQLLQTKAVEQIMAILSAEGVKPENIVLDVSERIEFRDEEKALSTLEILHAHGMKIAMDDFGSGRQSITMLGRLKASYVKFDPSFLANSSDHALKEGILAAVHTMVKTMGGKIGFVGVENASQKEFALTHGGECMEGYAYGMPLAADDFEARWRKL